MDTSRIIAIVGGTGAQGGGLARAILDDPSGGFTARVLTRHPSSERAQELARRGAEITVVHLDDPGSVQRAFTGAFAAFCVTNYWEHFSPEREMAQARTMAMAARETGLCHVIWSTLEDTRLWVPLDDQRLPTLRGRYKVPHFDGKGESNQFFIESGVPTTFLLTSFYWDNLIHFRMGPRRRADGMLAITFPMDDRKLPGIAAEDIGRCAYGIFTRGAELVGQTVGIAGEHLTCAEMASRLSAVLGQEVQYDSVTPEVYRSVDIAGAQDLANMFQFKRDFEVAFCGARSVELSRSLNPLLQSFDRWLVEQGHRLLSE